MDTPENWGVAAVVDALPDTKHGQSQDRPVPPVAPAIEPILRTARNRAETDVSIGLVRLKVLKPYALARLGYPASFLDLSNSAVPAQSSRRSLRKDAPMLAATLGCGTDLIYEFVKRICTIGPQNIRAENLLKSAPDGGRGELKFGPPDARAIVMKAIIAVCVKRGLEPGHAATTRAIMKEIEAKMPYGIKLPSAGTVAQRSRQADITQLRLEEENGEHLYRVVGKPDESYHINDIVCLDTTTFSSDENEGKVIYVVDEDLNPLDVLNAQFGIDCGNRVLWTWLGFPGPANGDITGEAVKRGLCSKEQLEKRYNLPIGSLPSCGTPGRIATDNGSGYVSAQVQDGLQRRGFPIVETGPKELPIYRAKEERLNRTAHRLFEEFVESDTLRAVRVNVNGKPKAVGIRARDVDPTLTAWVAGYHQRPHKGLGGATPLQRFEQMIHGKNGFPVSGHPIPSKPDERLEFDFMWQVTRVVNHLGIGLFHRRYTHSRLKQLFAHGRRSSLSKVPIRVRRFDLAFVYVELPLSGGKTEILPVPWVHENDKLPLSREDKKAAEHMSYWEWMPFWRQRHAANVGTSVKAAGEPETDEQPAKPAAMPSSRTERRKMRLNQARSEQFGASEPCSRSTSTVSDQAAENNKPDAAPIRRQQRKIYEFDPLPTDPDYGENT